VHSRFRTIAVALLFCGLAATAHSAEPRRDAHRLDELPDPVGGRLAEVAPGEAELAMPAPAGAGAGRHHVKVARNAACPARDHARLDRRQLIVDLAVNEWARFGFQTLDIAARTSDIVPNPPAAGGRGFVLYDGPGAQGDFVQWPRLARIGWLEDDRAFFPVIAGYWSATPGYAGVFHSQQAIWSQSKVAGWAEPWSAAFVSWVMCEAGLGREAEFVRAERHIDYIDQAIEHTLTRSAEGAYRARGLDTGPPRPGDLLCASREGEALTLGEREQHLRNVMAAAGLSGNDPRVYTLTRRAGKAGAPSHCDIVIKVDTRVGRLAAIGGNVLNSVSLTIVKLDGGRPVPTNGHLGRPWFAVLELQVTANPNEQRSARSSDLLAVATRTAWFRKWLTAGERRPCPDRPEGRCL
jgi:hypothetical protein